MRKAKIAMNGIPAGTLEELEPGTKYRFRYYEEYSGLPVSLTMPVSRSEFEFETFPAFFEGLLPEGVQLEGLLRQTKIDRADFLSQLVTVGGELVGAVTVEEAESAFVRKRRTTADKSASVQEGSTPADRSASVQEGGTPTDKSASARKRRSRGDK